MSSFRHGDPLDDFDRLDREQARREARLPHCENCGNLIRTEHYYEIDGEILCKKCMKERYLRSTEDFVSGWE